MRQSINRMSHKLLTASLIALFGACCGINAADGSEVALKKGSWALQFGIGKNFTLKNFQAGEISVKYHVSDMSALRIGVGFSKDDAKDSQTTQESSKDEIGYDTQTQFQTKDDSQDDKYSSWTVSATLVHYLRHRDGIAFFLGTGPYFSKGRSNRTVGHTAYYRQTSETPPDTSRSQRDAVTTREISTTEYGLDVVAGVEWFVKKNISLHAEYAVKVSDSKVETGTTDDSNSDLRPDANAYSTARQTIDDTRDGFRIQSPSVNFGVSLYF